MVIDSSAVLAILLDEPEHDRFAGLICPPALAHAHMRRPFLRFNDAS